MAKGKKYDAPDAPIQETVVIATNDVGSVDQSAAKPTGNPNFVRKPGIYLQDENGVQYKFDRRDLPKKAAVAGNIVVDGVETPFQVTSNKGWTPEDKVIEYIWISLPDGENKIPGYITLDYLVPASSFVGKQFLKMEGNASRANPERVPKSVEAEERRKAAAKETLAKKAAEKAANVPAENNSAEAPAQ